MRVLFISNFPRLKSNKSSGIFVFKRLQIMRNFGIEFVNTIPVFSDDIFVRLLKRFLRKPVFNFHEIVEEEDGISYIPYVVENSLLFLAFRKLCFSYDSKKFADKISQSFDITKFDVIVAHGMYGVPAGEIAYFLAKKYNKPFVVFLHGSDVNIFMKKRKTRYVKILEGASKTVFVSNKLLNTARSFGYRGDNAIVIPNGYDPEIFYPVDKIEMRKQLRLYDGKSKYYVGFVGNLVHIKRADKLGEIFKKINATLLETKFIVVGDGPLRKSLEDELKDLDVVFTGIIPQKEVAKYMNAMDIMILPSRNEGWPCVVLEAQACGTCVVGSNNGGIPEAIGFSEYVVEDGVDFEQRIAERVIEVLENGYDKEKFINRARNYTWENTVRKEIELFEEIVKH